SERGVKATRSAKRTLTSRRSAAGVAARGASGAAGGVPASAVPHSAQNFAVGAATAPQEGQLKASGVPHSLQNLPPGTLTVWHEGQVTPPSIASSSRNQAGVRER